MKKKQYEKPSVEVVVMKQQPLLAGSEEKPAASNLKSYHWNTEVEE